MRTTLDIPDGLFREAKVRAAVEGIRLKDLITGALELRLHGAGASSVGTERRRRSVLPVLPASGRPLPLLSRCQLAKLEAQDDARRHSRSA